MTKQLNRPTLPEKMRRQRMEFGDDLSTAPQAQGRFNFMFDSVNPLSSRAPVASPPEGSWLSAIVADYKRAIMAAQRYEWLRRRRAAVLARKGIGPSGVSRLIFDEYFRD